MENKVLQRLRVFIKSQGITIKKFAESMEVSEGTVNNMFSRGTNPSVDMLIKMMSVYPQLPLKWLLKGEGEMSASNGESESENTTYVEDVDRMIIKEPLQEYLPGSNYKLIPLYSFDMVGGTQNQEVDTMGYVMGYMPFVNAKDDDKAVFVTGNSMYPTYPAGCCIQIRKIDYWREFIEYGQVHIVELMDDRRLIKEIRKGSDKEHLTLISHNNGYEEQEVSISFIRSVWLVMAKYEKSVL